MIRSAWISSQNVSEYFENKEKFSARNKTVIFRKSLEQIEEAIAKDCNSNLPMTIDKPATDEPNTTKKTTLKDETVADLLATFENNKTHLQNLFDHHRGNLDRFNFGNGYDFLTVLSRLVTSEQQKDLYMHLCNAFVGNFQKYIQNPTVSCILSHQYECMNFHSQE